MRRNVLVIEPNRILGEVYHRAFTKAGYSVQTCATAQAAIMAADEQMPDVVVLEFQLVAHSGVEFLYEFRSYVDWQAIPVVVHSHVPTGQFGDQLDSISKQLGIKSYLYKPTTSLQRLLREVDLAATAQA